MNRKTPEEIFDEAISAHGLDMVSVKDADLYEAGLYAINQALTKSEKYNKLIQKCKCGVYLTVNPHHISYESVEQYFLSNEINKEYLEDINKEIHEKMKITDTIVELRYYPNTPIGYYIIYHYDLEMTIDEALSSL